MSELHDALQIFKMKVQKKTSLGTKEHMRLLSEGYAAAAEGWEMLYNGFDEHPPVVQTLVRVMGEIDRNAVGQRGGPAKWPDAADEKVLRRYFERDQFDQPLRPFVEEAFDAGELDRKKTVDVHVQRLQRYLDRF